MFLNNRVSIPLLFFYLFAGIGKVIFSITYSFCYFFWYGISVAPGFHFTNARVCYPVLMNKKKKTKKHQNRSLCFENKVSPKRILALPQCATAV